MRLAGAIAFALVIAGASTISAANTHAQTPGCIPHIDSIQPGEIILGTHITILGTCFGDGSGESRVSSTAILSPVSANPQGDPKWSDTEITVQVSIDNATRQSYTLSVITPAGESNQVEFIVHNYSIAGPDCEILPGEINVQLIPGVDIAAVVGRHGGGAFEVLAPGSTDPVLSRWWKVQVPIGEEMAKVREYASDLDVEFAEPMLLCQLLPDPQPPAPQPPPPVELPATGGTPRTSPSVAQVLLDIAILFGPALLARPLFRAMRP